MPPPSPPPWPPVDLICLDTCGGIAYTGTDLHEIEYTNDQHCDDGGEGSGFDVCPHGTDCTDCGQRWAHGVYECVAIVMGQDDACNALLATHGNAASACVFSYYDLSQHNDPALSRLRGHYMCALATYSPPPPPPEAQWSMAFVLDMLSSTVTADAGMPGGALLEAVAGAVQTVASTATVTLTANEQNAGRRLGDDSFTVVNAYACDAAYCDANACASEPTTRLVYQINIGTSFIAQARLFSVQTALVNSVAQFAEIAGSGALCTIGDSGFVELAAPLPPPT